MTLGYPPGLFALAALVPLVLFYFLRRRQKPRVVSALFLWRVPSRRAEAGPRFERFSREASLLFEAAAIVAAALFLADLRFSHQDLRKHAVVVLDGSLSMRASIGGETVAERALRELRHVVAEEGADLLTVVESGPRSKVLVGPQADAQRALGSLASWRPSQPAHDFGPALLLARELAATKGGRIWLITDGPPTGDPAWPQEAQVRSVGEAAENFAFTSAARRDEAGVAQVSLQVASFAKDRKTVTVVVGNEDGDQRQSIELEPGASALVRMALRTNRPLHATLPPDALSLDSDVVLPPSPTTSIAVGLDAGLDPAATAALRRFLAVAPGAHLAAANPTVTWGAPGTQATVTLGAKGKLRSFVGPFFADKADPLLDDVHLAGVIWAAGDNPPGRPLVSMGDAAFISEEDDGRLHMNLDLARSNVQRTTAWPVLLGNVVRDARLKVPGFARKTMTLGEEADVVIDAKGRYELESPSGAKHPLSGAVATRLPLDEAGEWKLSKDGRPLDALVVLPLDARESNLLTRGKYEINARASSGTALGAESPRPRWLLGLMLLLLLLDFWMTASSIGLRRLTAQPSGVS
jgi:hypothetical protein